MLFITKVIVYSKFFLAVSTIYWRFLLRVFRVFRGSLLRDAFEPILQAFQNLS